MVFNKLVILSSYLDCKSDKCTLGNLEKHKEENKVPFKKEKNKIGIMLYI